MNPNNHNVIAWLVLVVLGAIIVTACQPTSPIGVSTEVDSSPTRSIVTSPTESPTQPAEPIDVTSEVITNPTETREPPISTVAIPINDKLDFTVCNDLSNGIASLATPSPAAGISVEMDSMFPPAPPAKVEGIYLESGILLTWVGTGTDVDQFYKIYRRIEGDDCWQLISLKMIEGDNKGGYEFEANDIVQTDNTIFAITTVDIYSNESRLSIAEFPGTGP